LTRCFAIVIGLGQRDREARQYIKFRNHLIGSIEGEASLFVSSEALNDSSMYIVEQSRRIRSLAYLIAQPIIAHGGS
jgi:hypothetical protein